MRRLFAKHTEHIQAIQTAIIINILRIFITSLHGDTS
nr:MAG TPA: hypothetical protein [Caudoviricetes sp.]